MNTMANAADFNTGNTFEELETAMHDYSGYPTKPVAPRAPTEKTGDAMRDYADKLDEHERALAEYKVAEKAAATNAGKLFDIWFLKLRMEYPHLPTRVFDVVYSKAYDDGHSSGYYSVREKVDTLVDFLDAAQAAYKPE
jgi:hypothetical protein